MNKNRNFPWSSLWVGTVSKFQFHAHETKPKNYFQISLGSRYHFRILLHHLLPSFFSTNFYVFCVYGKYANAPRIRKDFYCRWECCVSFRWPVTSSIRTSVRMWSWRRYTTRRPMQRYCWRHPNVTKRRWQWTWARAHCPLLVRLKWIWTTRMRTHRRLIDEKSWPCLVPSRQCKIWNSSRFRLTLSSDVRRLRFDIVRSL